VSLSALKSEFMTLKKELQQLQDALPKFVPGGPEDKYLDEFEISFHCRPQTHTHTHHHTQPCTHTHTHTHDGVWMP
jgi:hypothetical protein